MLSTYLFYMWFVFGDFQGYDLRNCEFYERYPGAVLAGEPTFVRCEGPPLEPVGTTVEPALEPKPLRTHSSVRTRTARR